MKLVIPPALIEIHNIVKLLTKLQSSEMAYIEMKIVILPALTLSILSKKLSADNILKYFYYFSQKTGFGISCKLSPGDNVHEMTNPFFQGKIRKISTCHLLN